MIKLRPYQDDIIKQVREKFLSGDKRVLSVAPTGAGKTVMFSYLAQKLEAANKKVLVLVDRKELNEQSYETFVEFDLTPVQIKGGTIKKGCVCFDDTANAFVAMVETLGRNTKHKDICKFLSGIQYVIIDEAHKSAFRKLFEFLPNARILGFTATPVATKSNPLSKLYDSMVVGTDTTDLIKLGFLSMPRYFVDRSADVSGLTNGKRQTEKEEANRMDRASVYGGLIKNYKRHGVGKTIVFCVNIEHVKKTKQAFINAGYPSKNVDFLTGECKPSRRNDVLSWYKHNSNAILINCAVLTTGFNEKSIETIILNRATTSLALYCQMVGRGSRSIENVKDSFVVLDMGGNVERFGRWEMERDWFEYWEYVPRKSKPQPEMLKECESCESLISSYVKTCPICGAKQEKVKKKPVQDVELVELKNNLVKVELPPHLKAKEGRTFLMSTNELVERQMIGNLITGKRYKIQWIYNVLVRHSREKREQMLKELAQLKGTDYLSITKSYNTYLKFRKR